MNKICELPNSLKIEGSELTVSLFLDPKLAWFKGHFPEQSILPGVAQIDWARLYAAKIAAHNILKSCLKLNSRSRLYQMKLFL